MYRGETNMYIFEIYINGEKFCNAGDENIKSIQSSLYLLRDDELVRVEFKTRGTIRNVDGSFERVSWLDKLLQVGDEIRVRISENNCADKYEIDSQYGTVFHSTTIKERHCSFCGGKESEVGNMVEGFGGNICKDCILVCYNEIKPNIDENT